jgi:hypothetical protein
MQFLLKDTYRSKKSGTLKVSETGGFLSIGVNGLMAFKALILAEGKCRTAAATFAAGCLTTSTP